MGNEKSELRDNLFIKISKLSDEQDSEYLSVFSLIELRAYHEFMVYFNEVTSAKATKLAVRGRPKSVEYNNQDCFRAFTLWNIKQKFPSAPNSTRSLIGIFQKVDAKSTEVFPDRPFKHGTAIATLESSVSRGKRKLKINANWESKVCEKLMVN